MLIIIVTNLIVAATAGLLMSYFFPFEGVVDYLLAFFLLCLAQIILSLELLGIFNSLYLTNVIFLNLAVLIFVFLLIRSLKLAPALGFNKKFKESFNRFSLNGFEIFCLAVIISFVAVKVSINLMNPPFGWDSLNYHFTYPVEWLKYGNLNMSISISGDPSVS
ncbi:MAG: hypothetical protein WC616_04695, partial [Candidatus Omnitrophota bacterium]